MRRAICSIVVLLSTGPAAVTTGQGPATADPLLGQLVALERSALDRWIRLDPQGYLDLYAEELSYFDPSTERRVDGPKEMQERVAGMKDLKPPFTNPRYELLDPRVQRHADVAVLTFNVVNYGTLPGRAEDVLARWNSTEVYRRVGGSWKIIHSHWSYVKPELKRPAAVTRLVPEQVASSNT